MKLLGSLLWCLAVTFSAWRRLRGEGHARRRAEEAVALLLSIESGIQYLSLPLGELLKTYAAEHRDSLILQPAEAELASPEAMLQAGQDRVQTLLTALFRALAAADGASAEAIIAYYRVALQEEIAAAEARLAALRHVWLPVSGALALLTVILLW